MARLIFLVLALFCTCCYTSATFMSPLQTRQTWVPPKRELTFFYNQRFRTRDLWDAIDNDDLKLFFTIMRCGCVNLEESDDEEERAIHKAVRIGNEEMVAELIKAGVDVNAQDTALFSPLHVSVRAHDFNITSLLLEARADVKRENSGGERPLVYAQSRNDIKLVELLIRHGSEINHQDHEGVTCQLTKQQWLECRLGVTALHEASAYGAPKNAQYLIDHGANWTIVDDNDRKPIDWICDCLEFDERVLVPCEFDACNTSVRRQLERVFQRAESGNGMMAGDNETIIVDLWTAIVEEDLGDVREILSCDCVQLQVVTPSKTADWEAGQTALHLAVVQGNFAIVSALINTNSRLDAPNTIGNTPIHLATEQNHIPIVRLLLKEGVSPNNQNDDGITPLHIAAEQGFLQIIKLLIQYNASPNAHNKEGSTPIELLCACRLDNSCKEGFCDSSKAVISLMDAIGEEDDARRIQTLQLYFPGNTIEDQHGFSSEPTEDDGASALGTFIGLLFSLSLVFVLIYSIIIYSVRRRRLRRQIAQALNHPGPSNGHFPQSTTIVA